MSQKKHLWDRIFDNAGSAAKNGAYLGAAGGLAAIFTGMVTIAAGTPLFNVLGLLALPILEGMAVGAVGFAAIAAVATVVAAPFVGAGKEVLQKKPSVSIDELEMPIPKRALPAPAVNVPTHEHQHADHQHSDAQQYSHPVAVHNFEKPIFAPAPATNFSEKFRPNSTATTHVERLLDRDSTPIMAK